MNRFGAPHPPIQTNRFKATGLGGQTEYVVPDENVPEEDLHGDAGFTSIKSRSRFAAPTRPTVYGHGYDQGGTNARGQGRDPATGRSQFDEFDRDPGAPWRNRRLTTSDIGADDEILVKRGLLSYIRRWVALPKGGTHAADLPRWSDAGPIPTARQQRRYTLRREFEQNAQNFLGMHTVFKAGAAMSTSPVRMGAPRTNRLTNRNQPGSYGQETVVLNA